MNAPRPAAVPGRVVWFFPNGSRPAETFVDPTKPLAALVTYVWDDGTVNPIAFEQQSQFYLSESKVSILIDGEPKPEPPIPFARWMPFQVGQAKLTAEQSQSWNEANARALDPPLPVDPACGSER